MNNAPDLNGIEDCLSRALRQFEAFQVSTDRNVAPARDIWQLEHATEKMHERLSEWLRAVPALRDVQTWVNVHWHPQRQTQPPESTIPTEDEWGNEGETQIDSERAAFKLLLAAYDYRAENVAQVAVEFATHGMIEVCSFYLLKGMSVSKRIPLDDYCTLLPYEEALKKVMADPSSRDTAERLGWPPETADDVCALEARSFEHRGLAANDFERRVSRLLRCGSETLALILGLVWGNGFRVCGHWQGVPASVAAALPFFSGMSSRGGRGTRVMFAPRGWRPPNAMTRPLAVGEVADLIDGYAMLSAQSRKSLVLALRRLRDSTERIGIEDKVMDVCIALEALFMDGERWNQKKVISRRASWHFADSLLEREQTRDLIKAFYDRRSEIVHGNTPDNLTPEEKELDRAQLTNIENLVRTSLKTMISDGRQQSWEDSRDWKSIRYDPPRAETEIPSVKSDSLSWTLKEQREIDQSLEAVWKPTVDNAPAPSSDAHPVCYEGVNREQIEQYKRKRIYYIIRIPALLYMAHPKWLERADEPLDDHTRYYCERDVYQHFERWRKAAAEKKVHQFELPLEPGMCYLPKHFDYWRTLI